MNPTYHAFTGTKYTKAQAVALAQSHFDADNYVTGTYGIGDFTNATSFKGCSVGCMAGGVHQDFAKLYGIPPQIAYLCDAIFENLPKPEHKVFTTQVFQAIPERANLDRVWDKFSAWNLAQTKSALTCVNNMVVLFNRASNGDEPSEEEWNSAEWYAWAASAAWTARAARTAMAARDASDARYARAAWNAIIAWDASAVRYARTAWTASATWDESATWSKKSRDKLIEILASSPVVEVL